MKILGDNFDTEENILKLVSISTPKSDYDFTVEQMETEAGWVYVTGKMNGTEYSINYSSVMFDNLVFIQFFAELIELKDDIAIFLDYEGIYPLLYVKNIDNDTLRFVFAHDYILHKNDEDYNDCLQFKIEFDILISTKDLLSKFYNILNLFVSSYDTNEYSLDTYFNILKAKKYLEKIKSYINEDTSNF